MAVIVILRGEEHLLPAPLTLAEALRLLELPPELYLAVRNGELISEDTLLENGDRVQLVSVISGG
jgi:sulfur carrier protein ThiS